MAGRVALPQGTLELLMFRTIALEPQHGHAISERIRAAAAFDALMASLSYLWTLVSPSWAQEVLDQPVSSLVDPVTGWHEHMPIDLRIRASTTGC